MNAVVDLMTAVLKCDCIDPFTRLRAEMLLAKASGRQRVGSIFARH